VVVNLLARQDSTSFQDGLYWVVYQDLPSRRVRERLLEKFDNTYLIHAPEGADSFFFDLAKELGLGDNTNIIPPKDSEPQ
jgi:hypothetical protein